MPDTVFLKNTYLCGCIWSKLGHMGSLIFIVACLVGAPKPLVAACGISFPNQGLNLGPLHHEREILVIGPPRKSPGHYFKDFMTENILLLKIPF